MKRIPITLTFDVEAGKFESDGNRNCKYCASFESFGQALAAFEMVNDYPYAELNMTIVIDDVPRCINLIGGDDPELRLRMDVANLWMKATGNSFANVAMSAEEQITDIHLVLQGASNRLYNQAQEIKALQKQVLASAKPTWQMVKRYFDSGEICWSEAFEHLMSECGMSMEQALQCLAENFDRRPAAIATEV